MLSTLQQLIILTLQTRTLLCLLNLNFLLAKKLMRSIVLSVSIPCFRNLTFIEGPLDAKFKEHSVSHSRVQSEEKVPEEYESLNEK